MTRTRHQRLQALALAALVSGCTSKSFHHGGGDGDTNALATATAGGFFGTTGDPASSPSNFDGNYPEPAVTRCGEVLGDDAAIGELSSAWAVIAVPNATRGGVAVETGSMLLRLSEGTIRECGDGPDADGFAGSSSGFGVVDGSGDGVPTWARGIEVMLGPDELGLGVHMFADFDTPGLVVYGDGASEEPNAGASIELLRADDDCVIGVVRNFQTTTGEPFMEGGFVVQTCQRQCIPANGRSC